MQNIQKNIQLNQKINRRPEAQAGDFKMIERSEL